MNAYHKEPASENFIGQRFVFLADQQEVKKEGDADADDIEHFS